MPKYLVTVSWTMCGIANIEADSEGEARRKAYDDDKLPDGAYLNDSFVVDSVEEEIEDSTT